MSCFVLSQIDTYQVRTIALPELFAEYTAIEVYIYYYTSHVSLAGGLSPIEVTCGSVLLHIILQCLTEFLPIYFAAIFF